LLELLLLALAPTVTVACQHLQHLHFIVVICKAAAVKRRVAAHITAEQLVHVQEAGQVEAPKAGFSGSAPVVILPLPVTEEEEQVDIHVQVLIYTVQLGDMAAQFEVITVVLVEFMYTKA
jgi:hypothetical protein